MNDPIDNTLFQSEHHPLVNVVPIVLEDYCLSLIHTKAYETAAEVCRERDVLDLGCNEGYGTAIVARGARSATGIDLSLRAVEAARRSYPHLTFRHLTEPQLPFPDESFDVITAFQVIEHVEHVEPFLREVRRVLRPSGRALFTTPNRLVRLDPGTKPWNPFHVREYTAAELERELAAHFEHVNVRGLQAKAPLDQIERRRLLRHRRLLRSSKAGLPIRAAASVEFRLRRALRQAAAMATELPLVAQLQRWRFARYSAADLSYSDSNLDAALDLFATVRRQR